MGMATWRGRDESVRPSSLIQGGWYCGRCDAHYTPNLEWGFDVTPRGDTSGVWHLVGVHRLGDECPRCGQRPARALSGDAH